MTYAVKEVLQFIEENDVKFIRLAFCDLLGTQKNISIMPNELERAFKEGVSFDASAIKGFADVSKSDLLLFPDPSTLSVLPWRPQQGRVVRFFCDIRTPEKEKFVCDSRDILRNMIKKCVIKGYTPYIGTECEFYLFKTDEEGEPTMITHDKGGYFDIAPIDKGENIRREICLCLEEMGIKPESSHHEQGPGQNEIDFKYSDSLTAADNFITFKSVVKAIATRNGLFASFLPKPIADESGNGLHINLSLLKNGTNIFENNKWEQENAKNFIAGILSKAKEITAFLNPLVNSYERFGKFEAPKYISWSHQNRSQLIRIPAATGEKTRMELRSPDSSINPYIAFSLIIGAGLYGIENSIELPEAVNENLYTTSDEVLNNIEKLPESLEEAINIAKNSEFIKDIIGEEVLKRYIELKEIEIKEYLNASDKEMIKRKYFEYI
ncbi:MULTISPECIES: type I glutamate--ammonia ligase [unclassified Clostridium]|uniref:type I glutamate--ammonia ligase n=1 Tax=Clostridium TaxID=1485 RepID=UPI001C8B396E|nr:MULTISPECIES: type I glutamate--ammonia ligase [unclassified Clostridium]MBX9136509.1 type I glutamate--ammonia ligase [Clostridium sp. K12(2020)]MBX9143010.1 type I glutamate--ammonia ligase [Clostridium sp. K13]MDU2291116.1 type I glutamate--ammonia ligase [Clostridium celatum]